MNNDNGLRADDVDTADWWSRHSHLSPLHSRSSSLPVYDTPLFDVSDADDNRSPPSPLLPISLEADNNHAAESVVFPFTAHLRCGDKTLRARTVYATMNTTLSALLQSACNITAFIAAHCGGTSVTSNVALIDLPVCRTLLASGDSDRTVHILFDLIDNVKSCTRLGCNNVLIKHSSRRSCDDCQKNGFQTDARLLRRVDMSALDSASQDAETINEHIETIVDVSLHGVDHWRFATNDPRNAIFIAFADTVVAQHFDNEVQRLIQRHKSTHNTNDALSMEVSSVSVHSRSYSLASRTVLPIDKQNVMSERSLPSITSHISGNAHPDLLAATVSSIPRQSASDSLNVALTLFHDYDYQRHFNFVDAHCDYRYRMKSHFWTMQVTPADGADMVKPKIISYKKLADHKTRRQLRSLTTSSVSTPNEYTPMQHFPPNTSSCSSESTSLSSNESNKQANEDRTNKRRYDEHKEREACSDHPLRSSASSVNHSEIAPTIVASASGADTSDYNTVSLRDDSFAALQRRPVGATLNVYAQSVSQSIQSTPVLLIYRRADFLSKDIVSAYQTGNSSGGGAGEDNYHDRADNDEAGRRNNGSGFDDGMSKRRRTDTDGSKQSSAEESHNATIIDSDNIKVHRLASSLSAYCTQGYASLLVLVLLLFITGVATFIIVALSSNNHRVGLMQRLVDESYLDTATQATLDNSAQLFDRMRISSPIFNSWVANLAASRVVLSAGDSDDQTELNLIPLDEITVAANTTNITALATTTQSYGNDSQTSVIETLSLTYNQMSQYCDDAIIVALAISDFIVSANDLGESFAYHFIGTQPTTSRRFGDKLAVSALLSPPNTVAFCSALNNDIGRAYVLSALCPPLSKAPTASWLRVRVWCETRVETDCVGFFQAIMQLQLVNVAFAVTSVVHSSDPLLVAIAYRHQASALAPACSAFDILTTQQTQTNQAVATSSHVSPALLFIVVCSVSLLLISCLITLILLTALVLLRCQSAKQVASGPTLPTLTAQPLIVHSPTLIAVSGER